MIRGGVPIARPTRPVTEADRRTRRAPGGSARRLLSTLAFRNDQYLWWQMAEYGYDTYLIRAAPKPCETARFETGLRVQVAIPAATTCLSAIGREKLEAISLPPGSTHCPYQDLAGRVDHTSTHSIPSHPLRHVHMHGRSPITFGAGAFVGFGGPRRLAVTLRGNLAGPEHVCSAPNSCTVLVGPTSGHGPPGSYRDRVRDYAREAPGHPATVRLPNEFWSRRVLKASIGGPSKTINPTRPKRPATGAPIHATFFDSIAHNRHSLQGALIAGRLAVLNIENIQHGTIRRLLARTFRDRLN